MSRKERVASAIKKETCDILLREVSDPRIGFVSITDVTVGDDLKLATIFVSIMGDENAKKEAMRGLKSASRRIRYFLGLRIDLKTVPDIVFKLDGSIERGSKIFSIMNTLRKENEKRV